MTVIHVSAVIFTRPDGTILTVRKQNTERFMLPGGKPEAGESAVAAAIRECREELGVELRRGALAFWGRFEAAAANEPGHRVVAHVFEHPAITIDTGLAEIAEIRWLAPSEADDSLAPLLREHVLPVVQGRRSSLRRLAVFTGSASGHDPRFAQATGDFARRLADLGLDVVYGGGKVGLMGKLADAALSAGAAVHGVIPQSLVDGEVAHGALTTLDVVASMHERKQRMADLADGFVALPGGAGTLEELFEVWTWQQLGIHAKPVGLLDVAGFWSPLVRLLEEMVSAGFLSADFLATLIVSDSTDDLLQQMAAWTPPPPKWG